MALILPVKGVAPFIAPDCFIAENATIVGDVNLAENCSVWFNAVIRGDVNYIRIGRFTNIQDGAVVHCTYQGAGTDIGNYVSIGHNALVHGCHILDHVLVGMGAIVMDHARLEEYVIIAAGAVVLENTICESGFLYAGVPAKKIKPLTSEQRLMLDKLPHNYVLYASWFTDVV
ncbi:Carbonic anhydrase or acetyltransferase, isoleucine patch superfamily [bacterium A37T11]|nr:Carbonic anhydrase or acetyltransferase, isoleucine patch superfamily [bacterium A37T11]